MNEEGMIMNCAHEHKFKLLKKQLKVLEKQVRTKSEDSNERGIDLDDDDVGNSFTLFLFRKKEL